MKIVGGAARGRLLSSPGRRRGQAPAIRPTSARAREALFNILGPLVEGAAVLDLFAGTGAMGLEALSRGAQHCVFVDAGRHSIELITKNISLCGLADRATVVRRDLSRGLFLAELRPVEGFHLIFVDPPYRLGLAGQILKEIAARDLVHSQGRVVVENAARLELPGSVGDLMLIDQRRYGEAGFWFYQKTRSPER